MTTDALENRWKDIRLSRHLEGDDLETPLFKARGDGPNKVTLGAIRLGHDIGALVVGHDGWCARGASGLERADRRGWLSARDSSCSWMCKACARSID